MDQYKVSSEVLIKILQLYQHPICLNPQTCMHIHLLQLPVYHAQAIHKGFIQAKWQRGYKEKRCRG